GGSVGREGPIIQIGAAFGSTLGQIARLPTRQCVTLIAAGGAGGIAATFNAPLGGLVFAVELLLVSINARTLLPVGLATVVASYIGRAIIGTHPAFDFSALQVPDFHLTHPALMALFLPFGIVMGLVATLFVRGIYWAEDRFESLPVNDYARHAIGMLAVGVMIYLLQRQAGHYYVQGVGYATIMDIITGSLTDVKFLLLLFTLKFIATCCTLGSGGSGGVFSPALYMGATTGAVFGLFAQMILPDIEVSLVPFVLAGMAAAVGGSTGAMVTGSVMLMEMTADVNVGLPIIMTSVIACGIRRWLSAESIYTLKLMRRGHVVPQGLTSSLIEAHRARDVAQTDFRLVARDASNEPFEGLSVICDAGRIVGVASDPEAKTVDDHFVLALADLPLVELLRQMHAESVDYAVVVETASDGKSDDIVGVISHREIVALECRSAELV
ncbi:MAG: chloride channel protein, partial [Pirellulales bacterium]|nr:chloride channel protein [Pirellulales bacterium]